MEKILKEELKMNDNKFQVGEEFLYNNCYKATIFGVADKSDFYQDYYAISFTTFDGVLLNRVVDEKSVTKIKKKDELPSKEIKVELSEAEQFLITNERMLNDLVMIIESLDKIKETGCASEKE